ncbi:small nuclear ribonucleoprotein D1 [Strigomonas culicis]|uniref:Small nuclear ribonucleoprotein D1 n=1 Tax=Strigomonas culicis TaxID=28005 RepID=S9VZ25_9TRYP|nr:small nuclear ribonucleoprotein D1 [Strigomonas culicis]|eukprot:EPY32386.1 small nuclear ribonucleoprotein D1 [Strigomonas culicis]
MSNYCLVSFLQQLRGSHVEIELKNSQIVSGEVTFVDSNMNTYLKNVKITSKSKNPVEAEEYMVRGSTIRYVIMPESLDPKAVLEKAAVAGKRKPAAAATPVKE